MEESPIVFGDFLKVGAPKSDRVYEELSNIKKTVSVLTEVCTNKTHAHTTSADTGVPKENSIIISHKHLR